MRICRELAAKINDELGEFSGFDTRADAGEPGMIYVALRGAKKEVEEGEKFADEIAAIIEDDLADRGDELPFAISVGAGNKDLLLQIEIRQSG